MNDVSLKEQFSQSFCFILAPFSASIFFKITYSVYFISVLSGPLKSSTGIRMWSWQKCFIDCSGTDPWICFINCNIFIKLVLYALLEAIQKGKSTRVKLEYGSVEGLHTNNKEICSKELKHHSLCQQVKYTAEMILNIIQKCKNMILTLINWHQETGHNIYSQVTYVAGTTLVFNFL